MKPIITALILSLAASSFTGCYTIDSATSLSTGEEHVIVANFGWRLFNTIPVISGNALNPGSETYGLPVFFRDDITMDVIQQRFADYMNKRGKTPVNVVYHTYDSVLFDIPFTEIPIPIPYLFCYREIQISGVIK